MIVNYNNKKIKVDVRRVGFWGKGIGLMFRTKNTRNLLFDLGRETRRAIHSCFVFFDFLALWLDKDDNVLEFRIVGPFEGSVSPKVKFRKLIEIPINDKNKEIIGFFVGKR